jgi:hypothetical protein
LVKESPLEEIVTSLIKRFDSFDEVDLNQKRIREFNVRQINEGKRAIECEVRNVLSPDTYEVINRAVLTGSYTNGLEACVGVAGFGRILGRSVVNTLRKSDNESISSIEWGSLWNLLIAYFDDICDDYGSVFPLLAEIISPNSLEAMLQKGSCHHLKCKQEDPVILRFVVEIADAVFTQVRTLEHSISESQYDILIQSILRAYESEIKSAQLQFSNEIDVDEARLCLSGCNSLPVWIQGYTNALMSGTTLPPQGLDSSLRHIGDVLWFLDDLADLEEDVGTNQWSAAFLVASDLYGPDILHDLRLLSPNDRINWIYKNGIAEALAVRILESITFALKDLETTFGVGSPLANDLILTAYTFSFECLKHHKDLALSRPA